MCCQVIKLERDFFEFLTASYLQRLLLYNPNWSLSLSLYLSVSQSLSLYLSVSQSLSLSVGRVLWSYFNGSIGRSQRRKARTPDNSNCLRAAVRWNSSALHHARKTLAAVSAPESTNRMTNRPTAPEPRRQLYIITRAEVCLQTDSTGRTVAAEFTDGLARLCLYKRLQCLDNGRESGWLALIECLDTTNKHTE